MQVLTAVRCIKWKIRFFNSKTFIKLRGGFRCDPENVGEIESSAADDEDAEN